jgi:cbb3-type cytochrome oxidase maturation protein
MTILYVLVPLALLTAGSAVLAFLWATKNGQLDDLETPALRMLHDDDTRKIPAKDG